MEARGAAGFRRVSDALQRRSPAVVLPACSRVDYSSSDIVKTILEHLDSVEGGHGGYSDPETSLFVFNAETLLGLGRCCGRGCRHCPFTARRGDELVLLYQRIEES